MSPLHAQHVLRHDRQHAAQRVWPERGRTQQNTDADTADVRAREIEPLAVKDPPQHQFGHQRSDDREGSPFVTLENAVEQVTNDKNERDEERRKVAIIKAQATPDRNVERVDGLYG